jgi:hypothetical protein
MYACQWHLDIPFGTQSEAVRIMSAWGRDKVAHSEFRKARDIRLMAGHIGASPSHLIDEYVFDSIADFEAALAGMGSGPFREHAKALAPLIIPGSQEWKVFRILSPTPGA